MATTPAPTIPSTPPHERALRYQTLAAWLEEGVRAGRWDARTPLPSERDLAEQHGVSRVTARKALALLAEQGLVQRRHGSGTFASARLRDDLRTLGAFSEALRARGFTPGSHWLQRALRAGSAQECAALQLEAQATVAVLERVRLADGVPMAVECAVLRADALGDPALLQDSLYAQLRARGHAVVRAQQRIRAANASAAQAALLGVPVGQALLWVTRTGFGADGQALEWTQSWLLSSHWDYATELLAPPGQPAP
ncbi:MAG: GntR family transcriptional regulator [Rhodoferax sp.]